MKQLKLLFILSLCLYGSVQAQNEFITVWKTDKLGAGVGVTSVYKFNPGVQSPSNQLEIPLYGNNYNLYWEDVNDPSINGTCTVVVGTVTPAGTTTVSADVSGTFITLTFSTPGTYRVKVSGGTITRINFGFRNYSTKITDSYKLLRVEQWGTIQWTTMNYAFDSCIDMDVTATDSPNLSAVTSTYYMFMFCLNMVGNSSFNNWNTSHITNMSVMFGYCKKFNQPIGNWDISNVTSLFGMFAQAESFNQPIGNWNTGNVTNMGAMFQSATNFNQDIGGWNTSKVVNMMSMLSWCKDFNYNLSSWNTSNVTTMEAMFWGSDSFNQPLNNWDVSKVTTMRYMFGNTSSFNQPLSNWDVSNVTNMSNMFNQATAFNQPISNWNTSKVTDMSVMFYGASAFNQPIGTWNTANVTNMGNIFLNASSFNQNIGTWNLSSLTGSASFKLTGMDCNNYSATLNGWAAASTTPNNITIDATGLTYNSSAQAAHTTLTSTKGWTITGDTYNATCGSATGATPDLTAALTASTTTLSASNNTSGLLVTVTDLTRNGSNNDPTAPIKFRFAVPTNFDITVPGIPTLSATDQSGFNSNTQQATGTVSNQNANFNFSTDGTYIYVTAKPGFVLYQTASPDYPQMKIGFVVSPKSGTPSGTKETITFYVYPNSGGQTNTLNDIGKRKIIYN